MFSLVFNHLFFVFDFFVSLGFVLNCTVVGGCNVHCACRRRRVSFVLFWIWEDISIGRTVFPGVFFLHFPLKFNRKICCTMLTSTGSSKITTWSGTDNPNPFSVFCTRIQR